jgi:hypothetical protein
LFVGFPRISSRSDHPALAASFYNNGIVRTTAALSSWLRLQVKRGLIDLDNPEEAAVILIGMVASAPRRAGAVPRTNGGSSAEMRKTVSAWLRSKVAGAKRSFA